MLCAHSLLWSRIGAHAAGQVVQLLESLIAQEAAGIQTSEAVFTNDQSRFLGIEFVKASIKLWQRNQSCVGNTMIVVFILVTDVQYQDLSIYNLLYRFVS